MPRSREPRRFQQGHAEGGAEQPTTSRASLYELDQCSSKVTPKAQERFPLGGPTAQPAEGGREAQATELAKRAVAHVSVDDPAAVAVLLDGLQEAGAEEHVAALLRRDPAACVSLDNLATVARLLVTLRKADAQAQAGALANALPPAPASTIRLGWTGPLQSC